MTSSNLLLNTTSAEKEYWTVLESAGFRSQEASFLKITGSDAPDFLHRMSTNDVLVLSQDKFCITVLTTEKAKIVDLVTVINLGSHLLVVCSNGNGRRVKEWLEKFIIMEDIQITDVTSIYSMLTVIGPQAESLLSQKFKLDLSKAQTSISHPDNEIEFLVYCDVQWSIPTFNIVIKSDSLKHVKGEISEQMIEISSEAYESIRIEQGIPKFNVDFSDQINPLEAGFDRYISFTKGCYIGQEVVARLDTYKKLQKKLAGFVFDNTNLHYAESGKLFENNTEAGWITSYAWSYKTKKLAALGYVKTLCAGPAFDFIPANGKDRYTLHQYPLPLKI